VSLGLNMSPGETEAILVYLVWGAAQSQGPPRLRVLEQHLPKIKLTLFLVCLLAGKTSQTSQLGVRRFAGGPFLPAPFAQPGLVPDAWSPPAPGARRWLALAVPWPVAGPGSRSRPQWAAGRAGQSGWAGAAPGPEEKVGTCSHVGC